MSKNEYIKKIIIFINMKSNEMWCSVNLAGRMQCEGRGMKFG